jgi:hypothetical protein
VPFPGLLKTIMAGKFESQFKHRDEASVNAPAATASAKMQKVSISQMLLRAVRFGLPSRFSDNDNHRARRSRPLATLP